MMQVPCICRRNWIFACNVWLEFWDTALLIFYAPFKNVIVIQAVFLPCRYIFLRAEKGWPHFHRSFIMFAVYDFFTNILPSFSVLLGFSTLCKFI